MQQPALTHSDLDHPEHEGLAGDHDWAVGVEAVDVDTPSDASAPNLMQIDTGATPRPSITTGCCVKGRAKGLFQVRDAEGQADTDRPENPYITKLNEMKEEGLADALRADKGALFDFADHRMFGMLKNTVRDTVRVEHKGDWFDAAFLKLHTTPLLHEITEAMYEVFLYRKEDMIRHTGIRFHSAKANKSFLFDVQSFGVDRTYTPVFREEPEKPFKYKPIGHVFLSKGLLSLLSQIKSQKYGRTNNCRDGFMATIVICQFWNASLGIPQALEIDHVLEFIRETIKEDHRYFDKFCCGYTDKKAEEKRKEIQDLTDELSKTSHYDQTLEKMRKLDLIADSTVPPLFVLHKHEEEEATGDSGVPLPPAGEYDADNDAGQPLPE